MNSEWAFSLTIENKERKYAFWSLIMSFKLIIDITKKIPSLVSVIISIVFNGSFMGGGKPYQSHSYALC